MGSCTDIKKKNGIISLSSCDMGQKPFTLNPPSTQIIWPVM